MTWPVFFMIVILGTISSCSDPAIEEEEIRARAYLQQLNHREAERANRVELANWAYDSNITDENLQNQVSSNNVNGKKYAKSYYVEISELKLTLSGITKCTIVYFTYHFIQKNHFPAPGT